tara:strand:- start:1103 stop:1489 length:387 start_codon:yes stop_codon:yes gene_type:complete
MKSENITKEVVSNYFEAWKTNNKEKLLSLFTEDSIWEDPVGSKPNTGLEEIANFWDNAHLDNSTILTPIISKEIYLGYEALVSFTMQIRDKEMKGMDLEVIDYFKISNKGNIDIARAFWDQNCIKVIE